MVRGFDDENKDEYTDISFSDGSGDAIDIPDESGIDAFVDANKNEQSQEISVNTEVSNFEDEQLPPTRMKNPIENIDWEKIKEKPLILAVLGTFALLLIVCVFAMYKYSAGGHDVKWIVLVMCSAILWILFAIIGYSIDKTIEKINAVKILQDAQNKKHEGEIEKDKNKIIMYGTGMAVAVILVGLILYPRFMQNPDNVSKEAMLMAQRQQAGLANMQQDGAPADFNPQAAPQDPTAIVNVDAVPQGVQNGNVDVMAAKKAQSFYDNQKRVAIVVDNSLRTNPFSPNIGGSAVGAGVPQYDLIAPPDTIPENTDATKVMSTTISGIMYDKYNPSAIINIDNSDYLVKRGDSINGYRVLAIGPSQVTVRLGNNVYKAGVGEILKQDGIKYNNIDHLSNKFGGNNDVSISVKRRSY